MHKETMSIYRDRITCLTEGFERLIRDECELLESRSLNDI